MSCNFNLCNNHCHNHRPPAPTATVSAIQLQTTNNHEVFSCTRPIDLAFRTKIFQIGKSIAQKSPSSIYISKPGFYTVNFLIVGENTKNPPPGGAPFGQQPAGQTPGGQTPVGQQPAGQTPDGQTPVGQQPAGQTPDGQTSGGQTPGGQTSGGQTSVGQQPIGQIPVWQPMLPPPPPPFMGHYFQAALLVNGKKEITTAPLTLPNGATGVISATQIIRIEPSELPAEIRLKVRTDINGLLLSDYSLTIASAEPTMDTPFQPFPH